MKRVCTSFLSVLLLMGFGMAQTDSPGHPSPPPPVRDGVCLVLSGGGARGLAHIGVLKALDEKGWRPACIVGTSAGALVGSLYCAGYSARQIETIFTQMDYKKIIEERPDRKLLDYDEKVRPLVPAITVEFRGGAFQFPTGLIEGQRILKRINQAFTANGVQDIHDFDRLPIPFRAVATDLRTGRAYVFKGGKLSTAVRASTAIPFVFTPVQQDGMVLVDGSVINNLPVDVARELGFRHVIAVNVAAPAAPQKKKLENFFQILDESFALARLEKDQRLQEMADLTLVPDVSDFSGGDFPLAAALIGKGYESATQWSDDLAEVFGPPARPRPPSAPPGWKYTASVDQVEVAGLKATPTREVLEKSDIRPGTNLNQDKLDHSVDKIYALDRFRWVDYDIEPRDGSTRLRYLLVEKQN